mgnify:CR=1 FL=1
MSIRIALAALAALIALPVTAQDYPVKTVHILIPASPGGASDIAARLLESGRATLDTQVATAMARELRAIASARMGLGRLHSAIDWLGRKV